MKRLHVLLAGLIGVGLSMAACTPASDTPIGDGSKERILLISDERRDGINGPEALFEGVLTLTEDNCVVGEATDGTIMNLEFPADTTISSDDPDVVVMSFGELRIGDNVSLGGGGGGPPAFERALDQLPETCRFEQVFSIYTVS
ncbi:hypothetical protein GM708_09995 [Vibrio cholerae]|nr:hypothetical protein [Vibrio cholerae]